MSASKQPSPSLIQVPSLFSIIEPGVYRSASPTGSQISFLSTLSLKTILSLTPEHPIKPLIAFTRGTHIDFIHIGTILWRPLTDWKPIRDEVVKTALEMMLDKRNHPLLILDPDPSQWHRRGMSAQDARVELCVHVGGSERSLGQRRGALHADGVEQYRSHSGPLKHRYSDEQYIEMFDPELINLPRKEYLPEWWIDPQAAEDEEEEEEDEKRGDENWEQAVDQIIASLESKEAG
ncbi:hypothetical protein P7C73_g6690, partial [Tremellales sp. Uapishka_1]